MKLTGFKKIIPNKELSVFKEELLLPEGLNEENSEIQFSDLALTYDIIVEEFKAGVNIQIINIKGVLDYTIITEHGNRGGHVDLSSLTAEFIEPDIFRKSFSIREVSIDFARKIVEYEL